jgi:hypothetical protein
MRSARSTLGLLAFTASASGLLTACSGDESGIPEHPTYHEHVAPMLEQSCVSCHTQGGIAPFPLDGFEAARDHAGLIKIVTGSRTMPPIGVDTSGACNRYEDPRILTDDEITTIARWVDQGAVEGDPSSAPGTHFVPPALATVSATVDPGLEYLPNMAIEDDYRCFVIDPGIPADRFLTAYEVHPGERSEVHHVVLYAVDSESEEQAAEALDAGEEGPGYTCFGGPGTGGNRALAVWAPGTGATFYPEGTGLRMYAGRKVVMQVHYNHPTLPDRTTIDLTLKEFVPYEAVITGAADFSLSLPPAQASAKESATTAIPSTAWPYRIWGVYPHMHQLGRTMRVDFAKAGGDVCIVDVPRYDFHWQQFYFYDAPIRIPANTSGDLTIECTYDTRGTTVTTHWGEGTGDEMCIAALYVTL